MLKNENVLRGPHAGGRWKKGQSGNPNGRPKKLPDLDAALIEMLSKEYGPEGTTLDHILEGLAKRAIRGDSRAAEIILDRAYGKLKQFIDMTASRRAIGDAFPDELKELFPNPENNIIDVQSSQPEPETPTD